MRRKILGKLTWSGAINDPVNKENFVKCLVCMLEDSSWELPSKCPQDYCANAPDWICGHCHSFMEVPRNKDVCPCSFYGSDRALTRAWRNIVKYDLGRYDWNAERLLYGWFSNTGPTVV